MCLGEIGEVMSVLVPTEAEVRVGSRTLTVSLLTMPDPVAAGDWVVVHSGYALARLGPGEAAEALRLRSAGADPAERSWS